MGPNRSFDGVALKTSAELAVMSMDVSIYVIMSAAFAIYGVLFWRQLGQIVHMSAVRLRILRKVQVLTTLVTLFFSMRVVIIIWSIYSTAWNVWYFDALYFLGLELVPLILTLIVTHYRAAPDHDGKQQLLSRERDVPRPWYARPSRFSSGVPAATTPPPRHNIQQK